MDLSFMTREFFDTLILIVILIGGALAFVRLYRDFTRPLPGRSPQRPPANPSDTQPITPITRKGRR
jgi:hypothetical protein